jgi:hypothetical protein
MPLTNDPDWNNTPVIIDCSLSKKRKQREVELYSALARREMERAERYGEDHTLGPPAGIKQTDTNRLGCRVTSITPRIEITREFGSEFKKFRPTVLLELKKPVLGGTVVNIKNYTKHYVDPEHVNVEHQQLIGMMKQWKVTIMDIIREMEEEWEYPWEAFTDQHNWAKTCLERMMVGISKFEMISVGLLNEQAAIKMIDGIDDEEQADLAINLCRCKTCEIAIVRHDDLNNCSIVTIFDGNNKHKVAYGKKEVKDLKSKEFEAKKSCMADF